MFRTQNAYAQYYSVQVNVNSKFFAPKCILYVRPMASSLLQSDYKFVSFLVGGRHMASPDSIFSQKAQAHVHVLE